MLEAAFRDLHGSRLHGFALLVALGDGGSAEAAAGEALAAGAQRAATLRHPERAAAWLRSRVLRSVRHRPRSSAADAARRRSTLAGLGVDDEVFDGLAALSNDARAALVASAIERFETIDIETILGAGPERTQRLIAEARARYLSASGKRPSEGEGVPAGDDGPLMARVRHVARRAMSAEGAPR